jgi:hypothetical protein
VRVSVCFLVSFIVASVYAGNFDDVAVWSARDNNNSKDFVDDLDRARDAKGVAAAIRTHSRRQRRTTDELIVLIRKHPEIRTLPEFGLDPDGLEMWKKQHPNWRNRQPPAELLAISESMIRFNAAFERGRGAKMHTILRKYREDPRVKAAADVLGKVLSENRARLLDAYR